jgi:hypothetical protein
MVEIEYYTFIVSLLEEGLDAELYYLLSNMMLKYYM